MMRETEYSDNWIQYVAENRRAELLKILEEISRLSGTQSLPLILVGACSLLIRGCLKYQAWWDIDLLFKSFDDMPKFHDLPKSSTVQVFTDDPVPVDYGYLSSMQSMWGVANKWYRVDYIYRAQYYEFHSRSPEKTIRYSDKIRLNNEIFSIDIPVAHPWNMFIDKLMSPRMMYEMNEASSYSIDIRHLFILFSQYHHDMDFWTYLDEKCRELKNGCDFKDNLKKLLQMKDELGYRTFDIGAKDFQNIKNL